METDMDELEAAKLGKKHFEQGRRKLNADSFKNAWSSESYEAGYQTAKEEKQTRKKRFFW
jgi:hypothetical protein